MGCAGTSLVRYLTTVFGIHNEGQQIKGEFAWCAIAMSEVFKDTIKELFSDFKAPIIYQWLNM